MPQRIKIIVKPSAAHPNVLTIEDAMEQVLDIFKMIDSVPGVEWNLKSASTNSPLTIEGEAVSFEPAVDVSVIARAQAQHLGEQVNQLVRGELPSDPKFKNVPAKRVFERNLNGVGETIIEIDDILEKPISITPHTARRAVDAILRKSSSDLFSGVVAREEIGSIEGRLSDVGTHYNNPAVKIVTNAGDVWCRLSDNLRAQFKDRTEYEDIWQHRRAIVRGRIRYRAESGIDYVLATDIRLIPEKVVPVDAIVDRNFTDGLSVGEYLDRFREGLLGRKS